MNIQEVDFYDKTMLLARKTNKVPQNCTYSILIATIILLNGINCNSDKEPSSNYANRRVPNSMPPQPQVLPTPTQRFGGGSGSGATIEKRSSYAVLSQAMSQAVENEFGSKYKIIPNNRW